MEYIIWCDESIKRGPYYSNFFGGVLIRSHDLAHVNEALHHTKRSLNLYSEIKWTKVTGNYLEKYISLMKVFFDLVAEDKIKVRIMFTRNAREPSNLTEYHHQHQFHILYYYFFRYVFGLHYSNPTGQPIYLRAYFDKLPDTKERNKNFKAFIENL